MLKITFVISIHMAFQSVFRASVVSTHALKPSPSNLPTGTGDQTHPSPMRAWHRLLKEGGCVTQDQGVSQPAAFATMQQDMKKRASIPPV